MNCTGCGVEREPSEAQASLADSQVLANSQRDGKKIGRVCPRFGRPIRQKTPVLYLLLWGCFVALLIGIFVHHLKVQNQIVLLPQYGGGAIPAPRLDGTFPCVSAMLEGSRVNSRYGNCKMPTSNGGAVDAFETDLRDGNFVLQQTDLQVNDVFEVPLTRSYRSNFWAAPNRKLAFGINSNDSYDIAPLGTRNPYTYQMLVLGDGEFLYFDRISKGTGYADAVYMHSETSTRFYKATQQWNGKGWTMKLADGSEILFPESYNAKNLAQCAPTEMIDAKGNRLELIRDGERNLQEIKTPHGHWIKFWYDGQARIQRAQTDGGQWARYEYNPNGMLANVNYSTGHQRHYDYEGDLMTRITNETGTTLVQNWYKSGLLSRQQFENGAVYSYRYAWDARSTYPSEVWITLPNGTIKYISVVASVPKYLLNYHR